MNDEHGMRQFERLAELIGPAPALRLCARYGPQGTIYIPETADPSHAIAAVIGQEAFARLVDACGGRVASVPTLEFVDALRAAGQVACLDSYRVPTRVIASCVGRGVRRVQGIRKDLQENSPETPEGENDHDND